MIKLKKVSLFFILLLVIIITGCTTTENTDNETSNQNKYENNILGDISISVYENENIKVTYIGVDEEEPGLKFEVENKSSVDFSFSFDAIVINGVTEMPVYGTEVLAHTKAIHICDVSTVEGIDSLTGIMSTYDTDGFEIEKFSVKNVNLK